MRRTVQTVVGFPAPVKRERVAAGIRRNASVPFGASRAVLPHHVSAVFSQPFVRNESRFVRIGGIRVSGLILAVIDRMSAARVLYFTFNSIFRGIKTSCRLRSAKHPARNIAGETSVVLHHRRKAEHRVERVHRKRIAAAVGKRAHQPVGIFIAPIFRNHSPARTHRRRSVHQPGIHFVHVVIRPLFHVHSCGEIGCKESEYFIKRRSIEFFEIIHAPHRRFAEFLDFLRRGISLFSLFYKVVIQRIRAVQNVRHARRRVRFVPVSVERLARSKAVRSMIKISVCATESFHRGTPFSGAFRDDVVHIIAFRFILRAQHGKQHAGQKFVPPRSARLAAGAAVQHHVFAVHRLIVFHHALHEIARFSVGTLISGKVHSVQRAGHHRRNHRNPFAQRSVVAFAHVRRNRPDVFGGFVRPADRSEIFFRVVGSRIPRDFSSAVFPFERIVLIENVRQKINGGFLPVLLFVLAFGRQSEFFHIRILLIYRGMSFLCGNRQSRPRRKRQSKRTR